jgi:hypothetical protein
VREHQRGPNQIALIGGNMAAIESKRSVSLAQPRARQPRNTKPTRKKREPLPESLRSTVTQRGKTTIRRFPGRTFHRFAEAKGKALDYIEFFTMGEFHCIDVAFEDKTAMQFASSRLSPWKPTTRTGRPATGVRSRNGR